MMKKIIVCLFISLPLLSSSQNFGTDTTVKFIQKEVNAVTPPHEYFQLYNYSGDSIPMRWRVVDSLTYFPIEWDVALQDNITYHNPMIDSSDFILPDTTGSLDKIIINIFPNGERGYGEVVIDLINLDSTQEKIRITFQIDIISATNSVNEFLNSTPYLLFPNPCHDYLITPENILFKEYTIYDIYGKKLTNSQLPSNNKVETTLLNSGWYILQLKGETDVQNIRFLKN